MTPRNVGSRPSLPILITDLKRTTDLVVFDIVVDIESTPTSHKARIALPHSDKQAMLNWLSAFSIDDVEWEWLDRLTAFRVSFPIQSPIG